MLENITFTTQDGVEIHADYLGAEENAPHVLLFHMMPATRESWRPFMEKLRVAGFSSLAIDFRGHGKSVRTLNGRVLDYKKFSDAEQQAKILDMRAAAEWLIKNKSATKDNLFIVGASIGANLSLQYLVQNPEIQKAVLLSPGLDYRGIKTNELILKLNPQQQVLLAASSDDAYSYESVEELNRLNPMQTKLIKLDKLGHGTIIFENNPEFMDKVIEWLKSL